MKILFFILLINSFLFSQVYYAKVEPYEVRDIASNASGLILSTNEDMLGKKLLDKPFIKIDSKLSVEELGYVDEKIKYVKDTISNTKNILKNTKEILQRKKNNYDKISSLKIKSDVEKDREFYALIATKNQYLNTKKEINRLEMQLNDLKLKKSYLKKDIDDKNITANGFVLYSILVKAGQVVRVSTPLAKIADVSSAKLSIYIDELELLNYKNKIIYIDGLKTDYKVDRILNIADSTNISKYMAQIFIKTPKVFSKIVKVEFKDE